MDAHLVSLCISAVRDVQKWKRVLEHIMHETQSPAAIITLRDKRTCYIVNDDVLEAEHHSPLICGFPPDQVEFYLEKLRTIDPWAEAQQLHYPFQPTLMSEICDPDEVEDQRFFDWLNGFGIFDSVAVELDRVPEFWTALNIFSFEQGSERNQNRLAYLNEHFSVLQEAWRSTSHTTVVSQSAQATLDHLATIQIPACILTPEMKLDRHNALFEELINSDVVRVIGQSGKLVASDYVTGIGIASRLIGKIGTFDGSSDAYKMSASPFVSDPLYEKKKEKYWLVTLQASEAIRNTWASALEPDLLNDQERALYDHLVAGLQILPAGQALGIGRSRTYAIWDDIRRKLGIESVHQLRWSKSA